MKIREVMTRNPITVNIDASLDVAADVMSKNDVGVLPVEEGGKIKGILTDRDIVIRAVAQHKDPMQARVGDTMTARVYACHEDQDVHEVAQQMEEQQVRRVVVYDHDQNLVGIVSLGDIIEHGEREEATAILEQVSAPVHSMAREKQPMRERNI